MKRLHLAILLLLFISACTPPQQVLKSWVNREALPKKPYKSIFILTLVQNKQSKFYFENEMAKLITSRGQKAVKSSDVFTPAFLGSDSVTAEKVIQAVKESGCEAVMIIALLDVLTDETYNPEVTYYPTETYYGSYFRYYGHYYYEATDPGYYTTEKTYFLETNFYDAASETHLWSIQSDAYNPTGLESMFHDYSKMIMKQLKKEGLVEK
jgi:hypothetical protein